MRQKFESRLIFGVLLWIGIIASAVILLRNTVSSTPRASGMLVDYVTKQRRLVEIEFPVQVVLSRGTPVFSSDPTQVNPIGVISHLEGWESNFKGAAWTDRAYVILYSNAPPLKKGGFADYHTAPDTTEWVLRTMLPDEKRREISALIASAYKENQKEILDAFRPILNESIVTASRVIREELNLALEKRASQIEELGARYRKELVEEKIVPLVRSEIVPIVQVESEPLVAEIGQEIWGEVSVFGFGWRYIYDKTPLPDRKLTEREFRRFADEKAIPIIMSHMDEIIEVQKRVIRRVAKNPKIKASLTESFNAVLRDAETQALLTELFEDVLVNNERLKLALEKQWQSPSAQRAISIANERLEPTINEIGVSLFGSPNGEITPEFARVVRHRILHKDSRWLTVETQAGLDATGRQPKTIPGRISSENVSIPYAAARGEK
jgi:hypothetical protein